jgi:hypothetical protein
MTQTTCTPEEIEQLKANWLGGPCWDIEDTEGFEAHREELLAFRKEQEAKWEAQREERDNKRIEKVMLETGICKADRELLLSLHTFDEIEWDASIRAEDAQTHLMLCQVRATLLQAAQLKRIADALEAMQDGDTMIRSAKIFGSGE